MFSDAELMRLHVEALFTHNPAGDLARVNEPGGGEAPRFFCGVTEQAIVYRFRHDVREELRQALLNVPVAGLSEPDSAGLGRFNPFVDLLNSERPVQAVWSGPAFCFPDDVEEGKKTVSVADENSYLLSPFLEPWLPDVQSAQPMSAVVVQDRAVAVCCSVRRTAEADEAGVETADPFRGRGYAAQAVSSWAVAVRRSGRVPLYSTSWKNASSRRVASKLELRIFGADLHIT